MAIGIARSVDINNDVVTFGIQRETQCRGICLSDFSVKIAAYCFGGDRISRERVRTVLIENVALQREDQSTVKRSGIFYLKRCMVPIGIKRDV